MIKSIFSQNINWLKLFEIVNYIKKNIIWDNNKNDNNYPDYLKNLENKEKIFNLIQTEYTEQIYKDDDMIIFLKPWIEEHLEPEIPETYNELNNANYLKK